MIYVNVLKHTISNMIKCIYIFQHNTFSNLSDFKKIFFLLSCVDIEKLYSIIDVIFINKIKNCYIILQINNIFLI